MWKNVKQMLGLKDEELNDNAQEHEGMHLATAALLVHVSVQDDNLCEFEQTQLLSCLTDHFTLSENSSASLIESAKSDLEDSLDLYGFTRIIAKELEQEGRQEIVRLLWRVACADKKLDFYEEHIIAKISDLLGVSTSARIALKQEVLKEAR